MIFSCAVACKANEVCVRLSRRNGWSWKLNCCISHACYKFFYVQTHLSCTASWGPTSAWQCGRCQMLKLGWQPNDDGACWSGSEAGDHNDETVNISKITHASFKLSSENGLISLSLQPVILKNENLVSLPLNCPCHILSSFSIPSHINWTVTNPRHLIISTSSRGSLVGGILVGHLEIQSPRLLKDFNAF